MFWTNLIFILKIKEYSRIKNKNKKKLIFCYFNFENLKIKKIIKCLEVDHHKDLKAKECLQ